MHTLFIMEGRLPKLWAWVLKVLLFNAALVLTLVLAIKLFAEFTAPAVWYYYLLPLCSGVFVVYDIALTRVITMYLLRWRQRFRFLHK